MPEPAAERVRELEAFALERLPSMRLPDGAFCREVSAPGLEPRGRSLRYTLICLLGLQRARGAGIDVPVDPDELLRLTVEEIGAEEMTVGDLGLLLWADSRAGGHWRDKVAFTLHGRMGGGDPDLEGLELSWVAIGAAEAGADLILRLPRAPGGARGSAQRPVPAPRQGTAGAVPELRDTDLRGAGARDRHATRP